VAGPISPSIYRRSTPDIQFLAPVGAPADYFSSGFFNYYWFGLDSREQNDGKMLSLAGDFEYDLSDDGFFRKAAFGARWAERDRVNRNTNFSTWGNLSAPWAGRAGCLPWGEGPGCFQRQRSVRSRLVGLHAGPVLHWPAGSGVCDRGGRLCRRIPQRVGLSHAVRG
jgi:hypothetical protein